MGWAWNVWDLLNSRWRQSWPGLQESLSFYWRPTSVRNTGTSIWWESILIIFVVIVLYKSVYTQRTMSQLTYDQFWRLQFASVWWQSVESDVCYPVEIDLRLLTRWITIGFFNRRTRFKFNCCSGCANCPRGRLHVSYPDIFSWNARIPWFSSS